MPFTVVHGPDDGLIQSETTNCVFTDDLSFSFTEFLTQRDDFDDGR
jgi:hypothetical protein